ncbi:MAG: winged helix-turn-helix transcriptional regulator [Rhodobacteraceae bacterium]|nr:winged helix-turn-helix transcriptional regulator [Paracoccaceae bacterium]
MNQNDDTTVGERAAYVLDDQVGFLLRLASQRHTAIFQDSPAFDLTPTQLAAIVRLAQIGECSQNELGRQTAMDVATIKGVVDRLRQKGLVVTRPDPLDRRRTLLSLSPGTEAMIADIHEFGLQISRKTLAPLTAAERTTFLRLLRKLSEVG